MSHGCSAAAGTTQLNNLDVDSDDRQPVHETGGDADVGIRKPTSDLFHRQ